MLTYHASSWSSATSFASARHIVLAAPGAAALAALVSAAMVLTISDDVPARIGSPRRPTGPTD